jgi:hypothetical protein
MALELEDTDTFDGSIADTATETLEVDTGTAEEVIVLIDDGTTGNQPSQYTMTQDIKVPQIGDYQFYDEVTAETARSWTDISRGAKMRFTFKNTSGSSANYRITIQSYKEI